MLRLLFVFLVIALGAAYSFKGPFYLLLFYVWYAYFRPDTWVWDASLIASLNLSLVLGTMLLLTTLVTRIGRVRLTPLTGLVAVFLIHNLISLMVSSYTDELSWIAFEQFAKAAIITLLIPLLVDSDQKLRLLLLTMGLSLGFEGAKQGWAQLVTNPGAVNTNQVPFLGDNNHVAVGMLMLVPVLGSLGASATLGWERRLHKFLAVGVLYRALATYSRGGFLSALVLGGVALVRSKRRGRALMAIALVTALILPVMPEAFWDRMGSILTPGEIRSEVAGGQVVEDSSARGRLHFWSVARSMAESQPIFGVGHSNYSRAYNDYDTSLGQYGESRAVHSSWFGTLAELGVVGLLLFVSIMVLTLRAGGATRRMMRDSPDRSMLYQAGIMLETSMLVFCVGGTFVTMQYNEMVWHFIGIGMTLEALRQQVPEPAYTVPDASGWQGTHTYARGES